MTRKPDRRSPAASPAVAPDLLSDVLGLLRLGGEVFCRTELTAPWGLSLSRNSAHFHVVERGAVCFLLEGARKPFEAVAGDLVVLPHGHGHRMTDRPGRRTIPLEELLAGHHGPALLRHGGGGAPTDVLCGTFHIDGQIAGSVLQVLPPVIRLPTGGAVLSAWLRLLLQMLGEEIHAPRAGSRFASSRLVDLLFVQVVRHWLASQPALDAGWLAAMGDERIARSIARIHDAPALPWSVDQLAAVAGMSRSAFTGRFTRVVGESPLRYLTSWRVRLAARLLESPTATVTEVAAHVGYGSEAAFSRAFKRALGKAPAAYRKRPA